MTKRLLFTGIALCLLLASSTATAAYQACSVLDDNRELVSIEQAEVQYLAIANSAQRSSGLASEFRSRCSAKARRRNFTRSRTKRFIRTCLARRLQNQDADSDGYPDNGAIGSVEQDNCAGTANPTQNDADDNGVGDPCETVDLAVGSRDNDVVSIFYDLYGNAGTAPLLLTPDVTLDNATSGINKPRDIIIDNNVLYVLNNDGDTVTIFNDFVNLTDNQAPDITLNNAGSNLDEMSDMEIHDGFLIVANKDIDTVTMYNLTGLADAAAPDITLNNAGSGINRPNGIAVTPGGRLFVANRDGNSITYYDDVTSLADNAAPTGTIDTSGFDQPKRLKIFDDSLYVFFDDDAVVVFENASTLTDTDMTGADAGVNLFLDSPMTGVIAEGRLFIGSHNGGRDDGTDAPLVGYDLPLSTGGSPDVVLGLNSPDSLTDEPEVIRYAAGLLCAGNDRANLVTCHRNPGTVADNATPDLVLFGEFMDQPRGLDMSVR